MLSCLRLLPAVLLLSAGLLGCTDDDSSAPDAAPEPAGLRAGLAALWAGDDAGGVGADDDVAACFADELVERTTTDELRDAGVLDDADRVVAELPVLDDGLAEAWVRAQFACVDFVDESTRAQVTASKGKIDRAAYAACLREAITEDEVVAAVVATLTGGFDSPEVMTLSDAQLTCARDALPPDPEP